MDPKDLDQLIEKYLEGRCTREEIALIDSWYAALGKGADNRAGVEPELSAAGSRMLENIQAHASPVQEESAHRDGRWRYMGIAASVIFALAAGMFFLRQRTPPHRPGVTVSVPSVLEVNNTGNKRKRVILPDGSIVQIFPESRIRYAEGSHEAVRELHLEGEAYFDVAHDSSRPFVVYAGDIVTRVLGTSFIIRASGSGEKVTVSVKTGKVTVYTKDAAHKKTVLVPNQEAVYDRSTNVVATRQAPAETIVADRQHLAEMHFEETPVSDVFETLKKTYDIDIVFNVDSLAGCVLTSSFYEEGLYDRIDVICTAIGATYKIAESQIIIESYGCTTKTR